MKGGCRPEEKRRGLSGGFAMREAAGGRQCSGAGVRMWSSDLLVQLSYYLMFRCVSGRLGWTLLQVGPRVEYVLWYKSTRDGSYTKRPDQSSCGPCGKQADHNKG